jgi:tetratricopeptide (TPR) repeat protein
MTNEWKILGAVCALVIGVYVLAARSGAWESTDQNAADDYYNLLVQGFRAGQLNLKKEAPPDLAHLPDPYDPVANEPYRLVSDRLHDLSYYKGRLYLYFGVTPALIAFWPYVALSGRYLFQMQAVVIFSAVGFLASVGLLRAVWRRYFADVSPWVVAACVLALGLATAVPAMLPRSACNEVAVSCGYMLMMLTLGAIWCALHETERQRWWLAAASVAYGLAVGARPSLLLGAVILLVPVAQAWRERRSVWALLIAAIGPITLMGLGLMLYNNRRFGSPFEFGEHYQLSGIRPIARQFFHLRYFWFDFRAYFLEPARWTARFPFVREGIMPPVPPGYDMVEMPFGILANIPLVWLAAAVPLAWRNRSGPATALLRRFVTAVALLFGASVLPLLFYDCAIIRYQVDFVPAALMLATMGIFGLERALVSQTVRRRIARWTWGVLLGCSVAFNLLTSVQCCADQRWELGITLAQKGRTREAIHMFEEALRLNPKSAEARVNLGNALAQAGKVQEAIEEYKQALRINPDYAEAHGNLGAVFQRVGKLPEAVAEYEQALRIEPDYVEAHFNIGFALEKLGRAPEAIGHYRRALELRPNFLPAAEALTRLGASQ